MSIQDLVDRTYGPFPYRTDPEKVAEYALLCGADPSAGVPPALAGALLFSVTPALLGDPEAADDMQSVIHGDQSFTWHRPMAFGEELAVTGTLTRARERGGVWFTSFEMSVNAGDDEVVSGTSTFLMSGAGTAPAAATEEMEVPLPHAGSVSEVVGDLGDEEAVVGRFGASRSDLVRYAGASRDWNPIHWDHAAAVDAGLGGVVVHGLFQSGWLVEFARRAGMTTSSSKARYRRPLPAGRPVDVVGKRTDSGCSLALRDDEGDYVVVSID